jgi:beta-xylosidase
MKRTIRFTILLYLMLAGCRITGNYKNPIGDNIHMGDPFILLDDKKYYLYGTTGDDGFKAWKSIDFKIWQSLGNVYTRSSESWCKNSLWAPEVCKYNSKYYMTFSASANRNAGFRLCLAVSDKPEGPFKDLKIPWVEFEDWACIDAHIFIDSDSVPYLYFDKVGVIQEPRHLYGIIYMTRLSVDLLTSETPPLLVIKADQNWEEMDVKHKSSCNEGAFVFKQEGRYYLTYSSGHYLSSKYGVGYAIADSPYGPWIKSENNPLLQTNLSLGISGPGHNSITWSSDGSKMYIVYHVHNDPKNPSGDRRVFIDRLTIDAKGSLKLLGPGIDKQNQY